MVDVHHILVGGRGVLADSGEVVEGLVPVNVADEFVPAGSAGVVAGKAAGVGVEVADDDIVLDTDKVPMLT